MSRGGILGLRSRSSIAPMATAPMSAHGWWMVVSGTESRLAYFTSSNPAIRTSLGTEIPRASSVFKSWAAVKSLASVQARSNAIAGCLYGGVD